MVFWKAMQETRHAGRMRRALAAWWVAWRGAMRMAWKALYAEEWDDMARSVMDDW